MPARDRQSDGGGPEFFSSRHPSEQTSENSGPHATDLEVFFDNEDDKDVFMAGSAMFAPHMKSFASDFDDCGLHIGVVEFEAGLVLPLHSHSDNCVYYVERGSLQMGNRKVGPGEGFLIRNNQPYGFVVGPEGLRLIEFTSGPRETITFHDRHPHIWKKRLEKAVEKLES
jgi:hypothetical protein